MTTKQLTLKERIEAVLADRRKREDALRKEILDLIARGPPARSGISVEAWRSWRARIAEAQRRRWKKLRESS